VTKHCRKGVQRVEGGACTLVASETFHPVVDGSARGVLRRVIESWSSGGPEALRLECRTLSPINVGKVAIGKWYHFAAVTGSPPTRANLGKAYFPPLIPYIHKELPTPFHKQTSLYIDQ
jgi:hypothetical protein